MQRESRIVSLMAVSTIASTYLQRRGGHSGADLRGYKAQGQR